MRSNITCTSLIPHAWKLGSKMRMTLDRDPDEGWTKVSAAALSDNDSWQQNRYSAALQSVYSLNYQSAAASFRHRHCSTAVAFAKDKPVHKPFCRSRFLARRMVRVKQFPNCLILSNYMWLVLLLMDWYLKAASGRLQYTNLASRKRVEQAAESGWMTPRLGLKPLVPCTQMTACMTSVHKKLEAPGRGSPLVPSCRNSERNDGQTM